MSASWSKHCSAEEARAGCNRPNKTGVLSLHVECIKAETQQEVRHTPKDWPKLPKQGRAHTDVIGPKDPEVQVKLARLAVLAVKPDP
jgi:hypothetical protein